MRLPAFVWSLAWAGFPGRREEARAALLRARASRWEDGAGPQRRAVQDLLRALERPDSTP